MKPFPPHTTGKFSEVSKPAELERTSCYAILGSAMSADSSFQPIRRCESPLLVPLIDISPLPGLYVIAADVSELDSEGLFWCAMEQASEQRQQAVMALRNRLSRNLRLGATLLLDTLLQRHGLYERDQSYEFGAHGKPGFAGHTHLTFSLSHSGTVAAAALMPLPFVSYHGDAWRQDAVHPCNYTGLGVDVQRRTRLREHVADCVFTPAEMVQIQASSDPDAEFTRLWARHESHVKATGQGVERPFPPIPSAATFFTREFGGYSLSVCLI